MSSLRFALRAFVSRPPGGHARAFAVSALIGILLTAGAAYMLARSVPVAQAKRDGDAPKAPASKGKVKPANGVAPRAAGKKARAPKSPTLRQASVPLTTSTAEKRKADKKDKSVRTVLLASPTAPAPAARPAASAQAPQTAPTAPAATKRRRSAARRRSTSRRRSSTGAVRARPRGTVLGATAASPARRRLSTASPSPSAAPAGDREGRASPARPRKKKAQSNEDSGSPPTVTRTVRDIVEVVPGPLKLALAGLILSSALLAGGYLVTAMRARSLARQRADLLQDVGLLQTALLPPVPAVVGALRTSVAYRPSEGPGAGGDFYDALTLPEGRAAFILGDVCGHGRQALARTAFMRYTLRAYLEAGLEPSQALQVAGPVIDEHLGGNFATVVLAVHDPKTGSLTYACAGHPAPIVVGPARPEPVLAGSSPPIGLALRTGVRQTTVPLPPGSVVCLYTDGLAEARTEDGILGRPRLADLLEELGRDATATGLIDRVAAEARLVTDDMATVVLSPTAGVTAGGFREERLELNEREAREGLAEHFLKACGIDEARRSTAVTEARDWAGSHGAAVLHVRFGTKGAIVEVLPRNVESLGVASRTRARA